MKSYKLGKRENSRELREAKESEVNPRKVPTEVVAEAKTPYDLDLAIAEMVHNRQPYHVIAQKLKVSPKTISNAKKKIDDGTIKIAENGKAVARAQRASSEVCFRFLLF
jgi:hypothetical protein